MLTIIKNFIITAIDWKGRNSILILRVCLGFVFIWFGFLKFFPSLSIAEAIASKTISYISFGIVKTNLSMPILATWECLIGLGLLTGRKMPFVLLLLYLQMIGTFLPLIIFRNDAWTNTFGVPSLLGQYIIKNIILVSAGIVLGATSNGGALISNPFIAEDAIKLQSIYRRYERRFKKQPNIKKN